MSTQKRLNTGPYCMKWRTFDTNRQISSGSIVLDTRQSLRCRYEGGRGQPTTKVHENLRKSMDFLGIHGHPWTSMNSHGLPRKYRDFHGPPLTSMDFHGSESLTVPKRPFHKSCPNLSNIYLTPIQNLFQNYFKFYLNSIRHLSRKHRTRLNTEPQGVK